MTPESARAHIDVHAPVAAALAAGRPVVALESTIVTHGMPWPDNAAMAARVEEIISAEGAVPATIAVVGGRIKIGLSADEREALAKVKGAMKLSRADLAFAVAEGRTGGTTVAATMIAAALAGIEVFATGGIGGVHKGAETSFDISADLDELARTGVIVVSAGAKAILDIAKTLEVLETRGVPVVAYRVRRRAGLLVADLALSGAAAARRAEGDRAVLRDAEGARHRRRHAGRQPGGGGRRDPGGRDGGRHRGRAGRGGSRAGRRQGGDAVPAREDPGAHRRRQPEDQHRAGREQCAAGGEDRAGIGEGRLSGRSDRLVPEHPARQDLRAAAPPAPPHKG
jgi:hypothetical protein